MWCSGFGCCSDVCCILVPLGFQWALQVLEVISSEEEKTQLKKVSEAVKRRSPHTHYVIIIENRFTVHQGTAAGFYKLCECVSALRQKKEDSWKRGVFAAFIKSHHQHVPGKTAAFPRYLLL